MRCTQLTYNVIKTIPHAQSNNSAFVMCGHNMLVVSKLSSGLNRVQVVLSQTTGFQKVQISEYHRRLLLSKLGRSKTGKKRWKCKKRGPFRLVNSSTKSDERERVESGGLLLVAVSYSIPQWKMLILPRQRLLHISENGESCQAT